MGAHWLLKIKSLEIQCIAQFQIMGFSWLGLVWQWFYQLFGLRSIVVSFSQGTDNLKDIHGFLPNR